MPEISDEAVLRKVPDDVPKRGLFAEPVVVAGISVGDVEELDGGEVRVSFKPLVKDADGKRCSNVAVEARITGPHRAGQDTAVTNVTGRAEFRMRGPHGSYRLEILDVAAGGLDWDDEASVTEHTLDA